MKIVKLYILVIALVLSGCNAGSSGSSQNTQATLKPPPVPIYSPTPEPIPTISPPQPDTYFKAYYPKGCKVNNQAGNIVGTCECIQDPVTKDIWFTTVNNEPLTWGLMFVWARYTLNAESTCGITDWSWNLAGQTQLNTLQSYIKTNSAEWLNNNGFNNIEDTTYWGMELESGNYPHGSAWIINMATGKVDDIPQWETYHAGLAVAFIGNNHDTN